MVELNVEEHIPAFSMWKMLNETVPVLIKGDCSEASVKKLAAIIQSKEGSNIFINHKDPLQSFQQFQEIGYYYKAFTTWILGQFYYLLSLDKFEKIHDIIINVQQCILEQLSKTQLHIYNDLSEEYSKAFLELVQYYNGNTQNSFTLQIFIPQKFDRLEETLDLQQVFVEITSKSECVSALEKTTKFVKSVLKECFTFYSLGESTFKVIDSLLVLLGKSDETLKIQVIDIFIEILQNARSTLYENHLNVLKRVTLFSSLLEQYTYKVYNSEIVFRNKNNLAYFECLLLSYLELEVEWRKHFGNIERIQQYIFEKQFENAINLKPSFKILLNCNKNLKNLEFLIENDKIDLAADFKQLALCYCFKANILDDLLKYESKFLDIKAYSPDVSSTYCKIYEQIMKNLEKNSCQKTLCIFGQFLKYVKHFSNMLMEIRIHLVKNSKTLNKVQFFEEKKFLQKFLEKFVDHQSNCTNLDLNVAELFDFLLVFLLITNSKNFGCIFDLLIKLVLNRLNIKHDTEQQDFIGGDWELKKLIRDFDKYLSNSNITTISILQYVKDFLISLASGMIDIGNCNLKNIELIYVKVCKAVLASGDQDLICLVSVTYILTLHCLLGFLMF